MKSAEFTAYGLDAADQREVLFFHEGKRLAGRLQVRGDAKGPLSVRLEPWGVVTGRLVTVEGAPRPGALLQIADWIVPNAELQTDKDGRFRVEGLAPGVKYTLEVVEKGKPTARVFAGLTLSSEVRGQSPEVNGSLTSDL